MRWLLLLFLVGCKVTHEPPVPTPTEDPSVAWDAVLGEIVTEEGFVDYDRLAARQEPLDRYVAWVSRGRVPLGMSERFAWWINAHNALALHLILAEGRPASVRDLPAWWWDGVVVRTVAVLSRAAPDRRSPDAPRRAPR